jgi:hypothetical protein
MEQAGLVIGGVGVEVRREVKMKMKMKATTIGTNMVEYHEQKQKTIV